ncbi:MAG: hypothetical protein M1840_003340 [Geoglossum simile]|nr:MAG: hypothetical protein M1840_003340 [Geoglossum simile]
MAQIYLYHIHLEQDTILFASKTYTNLHKEVQDKKSVLGTIVYTSVGQSATTEVEDDVDITARYDNIRSIVYFGVRGEDEDLKDTYEDENSAISKSLLHLLKTPQLISGSLTRFMF